MAKPDRPAEPDERRPGKLHHSNWFFLDGKIHRILADSHKGNYVKAFDYSEGRVKMYEWESLLHEKETAYSLTEASKFVNRKRRTLKSYVTDGLFIPSGVVVTKNGRRFYFYSNKDIMDLRDFIARHTRNNKWYWMPVPTREQVRTMLEVGSVMYIKDGDDYVPVWQSKF